MNNFKKYIHLFVFTIILLSPQISKAESFEAWLSGFRAEAAHKGISQRTINAALTGIRPIQKAIDLDKKQPEWKKTFVDYRKMIVNPTRVKTGREMMQAYRRELTAASNKYGVAPQYIVALWGIETNYGANTGGFKVIPALATLAWDGRRRTFFTKELINALKILDAGHISVAEMKGSWAGAMGQSQFMPSSFNAYAVDGNGDGKRDIWNTEADVFASAANYLHKNGWTTGQRWGRRAQLPHGFQKALIGPKIKKPMSFWRAQGVKQYGGAPLPSDNITASIVAPDGIGGEAYIVYNNYQTIMDWNRSTYFATSVGLLADAIAR